MYELLNDPETLPFLEEERVHLPKLKHEIDRRILKIIALIQNRSKKHHRHDSNIQAIEQLHKQVQTESLPNLQTTPYRHSLDANVLSPSTKFNPNVPKSSVSQERSQKKQIKEKRAKDKENKVAKPTDRPLRMHRPQTLSYQESEFLKQQTPLLQSNGFTFRNCEMSVDKSSVYDEDEAQRGQYFSKEDFPMKLSCIEMCSKNNNQSQRNPHYIDINIKDTAKSEISRMSFNTEMSQRSSGNQIYCSQKRFLPHKTKRKMTDASLLESEENNRIQVSSDCLQKMKSEVVLLVGRRRKEFWDSKIRMNMLKKIEEKYAREIYDS